MSEYTPFSSSLTLILVVHSWNQEIWFKPPREWSINMSMTTHRRNFSIICKTLLAIDTFVKLVRDKSECFTKKEVSMIWTQLTFLSIAKTIFELECYGWCQWLLKRLLWMNIGSLQNKKFLSYFRNPPTRLKYLTLSFACLLYTSPSPRD